MIEQKTFSRFPSYSSETLSSLSLALYEHQKRTWENLAKGVLALKSVQTRRIDAKTFSVMLQFNPQRIVSTNANVGATAIKSRACFLCLNNLPLQQQGLLYREKFLVLCNPMPIFEQHFTVAHIDHIPQSIEEHIITLLDLSKDFSDSHAIFYNGPKCGASAPDHIHFQANPKGLIPVEHEVIITERREYRKRVGEVNIFTLLNFGRAAIILESKKKQDLEFCFLRMTKAMRSALNTLEEPMLNVLCAYDNEMWRMIVFPRSKHRPEVYYLEEGNKILISPAAVDMGGLIVLPVEKDFINANAHFIEEIFKEVSMSGSLMNSIIERM